MTDRLLTESEAADHLGATPEAIRDLRDRGHLPVAAVEQRRGPPFRGSDLKRASLHGVLPDDSPPWAFAIAAIVRVHIDTVNELEDRVEALEAALKALRKGA